MFEVPDDVDMDQDLEVEIVGSNGDIGYRKARSQDVNKLLTFYYPPKVLYFIFHILLCFCVTLALT